MPNWREIRLDIDPSTQPDVIGSMTSIPDVPSNSIDAIYSSHNIEHLYPHEIPLAFAEFLRVLKSDGFLVLTCPDLKSVCALIANGNISEPAYMSPAGPITPADILYGYQPAIARGNEYMAHRWGFTQETLTSTLQVCGFQTVATKARGRPPFFDLFALASKSEQTEANMRSLASLHFPI